MFNRMPFCKRKDMVVLTGKETLVWFFLIREYQIWPGAKLMANFIPSGRFKYYVVGSKKNGDFEVHILRF